MPCHQPSDMQSSPNDRQTDKLTIVRMRIKAPSVLSAAKLKPMATDQCSLTHRHTYQQTVMRRVWKGTISGSSCKAEAHGSRAGAASLGVRALPHLNASHVQEGMPEVNGACTPHHDFKLHEWKLDWSAMASLALHQQHALSCQNCSRLLRRMLAVTRLTVYAIGVKILLGQSDCFQKWEFCGKRGVLCYAGLCCVMGVCLAANNTMLSADFPLWRID